MPEQQQQPSSQIKNNTKSLPTAGPRSRQSSESASETLETEYSITFASDHTLQWHPPSGSMELARALSYHFPLEAGLESKMRAATKRFLRAEKRAKAQTAAGTSSFEPADGNPQGKVSPEGSSTSTSATLPITHISQTSSQSQSSPNQGRSLPQANPPAGRASVPPAHAAKLLTFDLAMNETPPKRTKRAYKADEAAEVAANRGKVCAEHKRRKVKCDPQRCPYNKQRNNSDELGKSSFSRSSVLGISPPAQAFPPPQAGKKGRKDRSPPSLWKFWKQETLSPKPNTAKPHRRKRTSWLSTPLSPGKGISHAAEIYSPQHPSETAQVSQPPRDQFLEHSARDITCTLQEGRLGDFGATENLDSALENGDFWDLGSGFQLDSFFDSHWNPLPTSLDPVESITESSAQGKSDAGGGGESGGSYFPDDDDYYGGYYALCMTGDDYSDINGSGFPSRYCPRYNQSMPDGVYRHRDTSGRSLSGFLSKQKSFKKGKVHRGGGRGGAKHAGGSMYVMDNLNSFMAQLKL